MLAIPEIDAAGVAFGDIAHMPKRNDIPAEFWRDKSPFNKAVSSWFFSGAKRAGDGVVVDGVTFLPKPGVDGTKALRAIRAVLGSFEPSHEHKEAACAYMLSEWFDIAPTPPATRGRE